MKPNQKSNTIKSESPVPNWTTALNLPGKIEWILIALGGLVAFFAFLPHAAGPLAWDDLLYLHTAISPQKQGWILNRYAHIYLLRFFFLITGDGLMTAKVYWCFVNAMLMVSTYLFARLMTRRIGVLAGIIALIFYLGQYRIYYSAGATLADYTNAFFMALACLAFLFSVQLVGKRRFAGLAIFGFLIFLALKSKENALIIPLLFLGLGRDENGSFQKQAIFADFKPLVLGGLAGGLLLSLLDLINLHDPIYWLRFNSMKEVVNFNLFQEYDAKDSRSWFSHGMMAGSLFPFYLYLLAAFKPRQEMKRHEKLLWAIPIALLGFLTLSMIPGMWTVVDRYFAPGVPLMCAFAGIAICNIIQGYYPEDQQASRNSLLNHPLTIVAATFLLGLVIYLSFQHSGLRERFRWNANDFMMAMYYPFVLIVFLGIFGTVRIWKLWCAYALVTCFWMASIPAISSMWTFFAERTNINKAEQRFYPYALFENHLRDIPDGEPLYVSVNLFTESGMLGRSRNSTASTYAVYFNRIKPNEDFEYDKNFESALLRKIPTLIITHHDLQDYYIADKNKFAQLEQRYQIELDDTNRVVLLTLK